MQTVWLHRMKIWQILDKEVNLVRTNTKKKNSVHAVYESIKYLDITE